jgi:predicted nucleotidyltransferase
MLPFDQLCEVAAREAKAAGGIELVVLFGSVVAGRPRQDSDADIGILGGEFWAQLELGSAVAAELGREPHVVDLRAAPEVLAYEIARSGLLLFERERFGWARFQARAAARFFDFQPAHELCVAAAKARLVREADAAREAKLG